MDKKAILAILLTFFVILFWSVIQSKFFPPAPEKEIKKEEVAPVEKKVEKGIDIKESRSLREEKRVPKKKVVAKKEVSIETQNYWAIFTTEDARLKHFKLKKFEDRVNESPLTIKLIQLIQGILGKKEEEPKKPGPLDLVNTSEAEGLPLGLTFVGSPPISSDENWEVEKDQLRLLSTGEKDEITFVKNLENGLKISKRYGFKSEKNVIDLEVEVQNRTPKEVPIQLGLEWIGKIELEKLADDGNKD